MRRAILSLILLLPLLAASPAQARGLDNLQAGISNVVQAPAEPVMMYVQLPEEFEELPGHPVSSYVVALPVGLVSFVYKTVMGAFDIAFTPLWVLPVMSPETRWEWFEIDYEE
jgi:hypothetical protein